jgi:ParB family transcriptional regulator, chromosome partitioning protein
MTTRYDHLSRLLGTRLEADARPNPRAVGASPAAGTYDIELARITPDPEQPRKHFDDDELGRLAASLKADGQLEPVRVRYDAGQDRYVIVCGERRYRAAQRAGLRSLLAIVDDRDLQPDRLTHLQLVENALRVDLSPLESARAYDALMATWDCTQQELAQRLNISESKVSRSLALLHLPADVHADIEAGKVGAVAAVKQARRRPVARCNRRKSKPVRIVTAAGVVTVAPKPGQSVAAVLAAALEAEQRKGAA